MTKFVITMEYGSKLEVETDEPITVTGPRRFTIGSNVVNLDGPINNIIGANGVVVFGDLPVGDNNAEFTPIAPAEPPAVNIPELGGGDVPDDDVP